MQKVLKEGTVEDALFSLHEKMPAFLDHVFVKRKQSKFFEEKKNQPFNQMKPLFKLTFQRTTPVYIKMRSSQLIGIKNRSQFSLLSFGQRIVHMNVAVKVTSLCLMTEPMISSLFQFLWIKL